MKKLSDLQENILDYARKNPTASQVEIALATGVNSRAVMNYHIKELRLKGRLRKVNRWVVK